MIFTALHLTGFESFLESFDKFVGQLFSYKLEIQKKKPYFPQCA